MPAGTSADIVNRLQGEVARAVKTPDFRERLLAEGAVPVGGSAADLDRLVRAEIAKWSKLVRAAGVKPE